MFLSRRKLSIGILYGLPATRGGISGSPQSQIEYEDGTSDTRLTAAQTVYARCYAHLSVIFHLQLYSFILNLSYDMASSAATSPPSAT